MTDVTLAARAAFGAWRDQVKSNFYLRDPHLQSLVRHHGRPALGAELEAFGGVAATEIDDLARVTNRNENLPRLRRFDDVGNRTEGIEFHPGYHRIGQLAYATGAMSRYAEPGRELETLALLYVLAQNGEAGHCCPFACTAGMIKILQAGDPPASWLERLLDPDYTTHFHASQFLTEVQGGSDVGANAVVAEQAADGSWRLTGEKWFCSVIDADLFLVTARPVGAASGTRGLQAFVVPRRLEDGTTNGFAVRRLKDKLGTRSMASAEVDFHGATAIHAGDFRTVMDLVINTSRLYNAVCSCGMLQRAWSEADAYARARAAFGQSILAFPSVARIVADLRTEAYAARASTFALAAAADRRATGKSDETELAALRMLVNLNKYWTSHVGTAGVRDAIEILGGNGAIEEFSVLPRLLRDSIVCEAWEGGHNVLCAQVLKDSQRLALHEAMFEWLADLGGPSPRLDRVAERWRRVVVLPAGQAQAHIRGVVDELRPVAQAAALRAEATTSADPAVAVAADHLLAITAPGWDDLDDVGLHDRVRQLVSAL